MDPKRWFHSNLTTDDAKKLLLTKEDGSFLSYLSQSSGCFIIAVRRGNEIVPLKISSDGDQYSLHKDSSFSTLWELLQFYMENPGLLKQTNGNTLELKHPVYSQSSVKERWFHGNISGQEAERLLMGKGSTGSYLMRSSVSSPGDMVLLIRKDNRVTNVKIYNKGPVYDVGGGLQFSCLSNLIDHYKRNPMSEMNGEVIELKEPLFATKVLPYHMRERVEDMSCVATKETPTGFAEEFDHLHSYQCKVLHSRKEGTKTNNQSKNRYPNIIPFDYNRLILKTFHRSSSDYINASYISGQVPGSEKKYIATQGCLESTVNDFWNMLYEEDVNIIIMATNESEHDNDRCVCYWPKIAQTKTYGKIRVQAMSVDKSQVYVLREFYLLKENSSPKYISQYHFTSWPDKAGMPDNPDDILTLLQEVGQHYKFIKDSKADVGPIVVHCNNGIGRTGSLIAIDIITDILKSRGMEHEIDIMETVLHIRNQRFGMVQTEAQYRFIYLAILAYIQRKQAELISLD